MKNCSKVKTRSKLIADGIVNNLGEDGTLYVKNCYSIGTYIDIAKLTGKELITNNIFKTDTWDDTYAYYTIGTDTG